MPEPFYKTTQANWLSRLIRSDVVNYLVKSNIMVAGTSSDSIIYYIYRQKISVDEQFLAIFSQSNFKRR